MTSTESAGASRRGRRLALMFSGVAALSVFALIRSGGAQESHASDLQNATRLLESVRGANPLLCAAVDRAFTNGQWGGSLLPVIDSIPADAAETARWIGRNHLDRGVLDVARRGMSDTDACVRRVSARLAGDVDVQRLDQELIAELSATSPLTRRTAVLALGFSDKKTAGPKLRDMLRDGDESVRLAAAWALGSIEDRASVDVMTQLLKSDKDPQMREIAAWALGRILG